MSKKHEWYGLDPAVREAKVLELLSQGYTVDMLNEYFDVRTKRVITDFMNARGYSKRNNTFIPKQQVEGYVVTSPVVQHQPAAAPAAIQMDDKTIFNIMNLSQQHDKLQEIIQWYDTSKEIAATAQEPTESYIEVIDTSLVVPTVEGEVIRTSVRVNKAIIEEFTELWKSKFSEYKQHVVVDRALQMFIDKYK